MQISKRLQCAVVNYCNSQMLLQCCNILLVIVTNNAYCCNVKFKLSSGPLCPDAWCLKVLEKVPEFHFQKSSGNLDNTCFAFHVNVMLGIAVSSIVRYCGSVGSRCSIRYLMKTTTRPYQWKHRRNTSALPVSIHSKMPPWNRCSKFHTLFVAYITILFLYFNGHWPFPFSFLLHLFCKSTFGN